MSTIDIRREVFNYLYIVLGSFALAIGIVGLLEPNKIATGGTAGLAIILHILFDMPTGFMMALINIPLLFLGWKHLGRSFAFKSVICISLIVVFIDLLAEIIKFPSLSSSLILATLYGGVCVGIGLGLIFKGGGSAGGGTIMAKIITSKFYFKTSSVILALDAVVVCSAGIVFKNVELALWSMISIYIAAKMMDTVLTGKKSEKIVHISSLKNLNELSKTITETLGVTGTLVSGSDLLISEKKDVIFIVVENNRINVLKNLVYKFDPKARMILMEASEMMGDNKRK